MADQVTIERHGDGFFRVIADGEEVERAIENLDLAVTWAANLLLPPGEGAHVTLERYPAAVPDRGEAV